MKTMINQTKQYAKGALAMLAALVLVCLAATTVLAADYPLVNDEAGLLTESEVTALQEKAETYSEQWSQDIAIYTTNSIGDKSAMAAADDYFDYNGFGQGSDYSGVVLLLDMGERQYWISTCGQTITNITDYGITHIEDAIISDLSNGNYADAFDTYLDEVDSLLEQAANGEIYDVKGASSHSSGSGSSSSSASDRFTSAASMGFFSATVIAIGFFVFGFMQLRTVRRKNLASDYVASNGLRITNRRDLYLYSNTTRQRIEREGGGGGRGGSSSHRGSSGRSHGGGGGRF